MFKQHAVTVLVSSLILAAPALGQSARELKRELRKRESAAKKEQTAEALLAVAQWAREKGMAADAKRLFTNVLKKDPANADANIGLGNAQWEGKWMPKRKADALRKKAMEAMYKEKGWVEVDEIWVPKDQVDDAKNGLFHHDGRLVTRAEKKALLEGMVPHPETGMLIRKDDLKKAEAGEFPIGSEGRWASLDKANQYYADPAHPWVVRSHHGTVVTTLELEKINTLKQSVDRAFERIGPIFGGTTLPPTHRPTILVATTEDEYKAYGNAFGDGNSAGSAFLMTDEARLEVPFQGSVRGGVCTGQQPGMLPYYARHAAGLAFVHGKAQAAGGAEIPSWFAHGIGALSGFYENDRDGTHFLRTMVVKRGGLKDVGTFLNDFTINGDMEANAITYNWTVAGLLMHFATLGGDQATTDAMVEVTKAFTNGAGVEGAIAGLQSALEAANDKVQAHMQKLLTENR